MIAIVTNMSKHGYMSHESTDADGHDRFDRNTGGLLTVLSLTS